MSISVRGLFRVDTEVFMANQSRLIGIDYESSNKGDSVLLVVRDGSNYPGNPIEYVSKLFGKPAVRATRY